MTILSDEEISEFMREGKLRITDFKEKNLTPNGYDLTIDEVFISGVDRTVNEGRAEVPPQT
ncbi:MAG: dCTP deaminase, partial [Candidatus Thermoplasmatota archaeon]|nr:dCTP deaminase [Candidatus Thermoplasmatota archaeon]